MALTHAVACRPAHEDKRLGRGLLSFVGGGEVEQFGGAAGLAAEGESQATFAQVVFENPRARTRVIQGKHRCLRGLALGVVENEFGDYGGEQSIAHLLLAVFRGIGDGPKRRIDREGQPIGAPFVGGPAIGALKFAILEGLGVGLDVLFGGTGLLDQERVGGTVYGAARRKAGTSG